MICDILSIYFWNEVQAFLLSTCNMDHVVRDFTSLGYYVNQIFLLKTMLVDYMAIPSFTQAFSQAQRDDSGIPA